LIFKVFPLGRFTRNSFEYKIRAFPERQSRKQRLWPLSNNGDVAQLGERRVRNAKVGSSILLVSTKQKGPRCAALFVFVGPGAIFSSLQRKAAGKRADFILSSATGEG
jgi:hypothetical protein